MTETDQRNFFFAMAAGTAAALIGRWIQSFEHDDDVASKFPLSDFFQPEAVADLAAQFPNDSEEDFIYSAWEFVGKQIRYEAIGSDMDFYDHSVSCLSCHLPMAVLERGQANCVGKSALLASLLLSRIPASRVRISIGTLSTNHIGGHAWVEAEADGTWYLLESTIGPSGNPWSPVEIMSTIYVPSLKFSPVDYQCLDPRICGVGMQINVGKCNCGQVIKRLAGKELGWL